MSIKLGNYIGTGEEEDFFDFDITEIQEVLSKLQNIDPVDLTHAEMLQQQALRGADILTEYLGKIVKTVLYLEAKVNSTRNKAALNFQNPDGSKTPIDMRKFAAEASPEVEEIEIKLAKAKASKIVLDKKFDILIRCHHHFKDIASGLRKTVLGYSSVKSEELEW